MSRPPPAEDRDHALVTTAPTGTGAVSPVLVRGVADLAALVAADAQSSWDWQLDFCLDVAGITSMFAVPQSGAVLAFERDGGLWRVESSVAATAGPRAGSGGGRPLALSPDGALLALDDRRGGIVLRSTSGTETERRLDASDRIWLMREGTMSLDRDYTRATQAVFSADGHTLLGAYGSTRVLAWDTSTGELTGWSDPVGSPPAAVIAVAATGGPDGGLVIGDTTGSVTYFSPDLSRIHWRRAGHRWPVLHLATAPFSEAMMSLAGDGTASLWHLADGAPLVEVRDEDKPVTAVCLAPGGTQAYFVTRNHRVSVWNEDVSWRRSAVVAVQHAVTAITAPAPDALLIATPRRIERWSRNIAST